MVAMARGRDWMICAGLVWLVPVAADTLEGIVHAQGGIAEVFHLLQDGIGQAGDVGITQRKRMGGG